MIELFLNAPMTPYALGMGALLIAVNALLTYLGWR